MYDNAAVDGAVRFLLARTCAWARARWLILEDDPPKTSVKRQLLPILLKLQPQAFVFKTRMPGFELTALSKDCRKSLTSSEKEL
jgi:hypothetical protein